MFSQAVRAKKSLEIELQDSHSRVEEMTSQYNGVMVIKSKLEADLSAAQSEVREEQSN